MKNLLIFFFSFCLFSGYGQEVKKTAEKVVKFPIGKTKYVPITGTDTVKPQQQIVILNSIEKPAEDLQLKAPEKTSQNPLQDKKVTPNTTLQLPVKTFQIEVKNNQLLQGNNNIQTTAEDTIKSQQQYELPKTVIKPATEQQIKIPGKISQQLIQEKELSTYKTVKLPAKALQNLGSENSNGSLQVDQPSPQGNSEQNSGTLNQIQITNIKANLLKNRADFGESVVVKYDDQIRSAPNIDKKDLAEKLSINPTKTVDVREIPEIYVDVPESGETEATMVFFPVITNLEPLTYDPGNPERGYKAVLSFVLYSEEGGMGQNITNPVTLEFNSSHLHTEPRRVNIKHLNLPSTDIEMFSEDVKDSVDIRIITNSAPQGYTHYIKVNPVLTLKTNQSKVQGLGIQEATVIVQFHGSSSAKKEQVTISSSVGEVEPRSFTLGYNEAKTVQVRSQGLEDIILTASTTSANDYAMRDSNTLKIQQVFPFTFLGFALLGGILGVLIKVGFEGVKAYPLRMMGGGMLMGLLGCLAYYVLGVNLLGMEVSATLNEFAVLTFSTLCSLLIQPYMLKKKEVEKGLI